MSDWIMMLSLVVVIVLCVVFMEIDNRRVGR